MAKIYTKKGDAGNTGLLGGSRRLKSDVRIDSYGQVDELNSFVGLLRDQEVCLSKTEQLASIQHTLFVMGSHLANDTGSSRFDLPPLSQGEVKNLELWIDEMDALLPKMQFFILPGGHQSISFAHIARTVCRRAERGVVALSQIEEVDENLFQYLNRLSDYLFVLARWMAKELNVEEVKWEP